MKTAIVFLLLAPSALAADMQVDRDLPYANPTNDRQALDIYAPKEGTGHPFVFWIHGGGWRSGDKSAVQRKPQAFVDKGFVFVSVNYRFVPDVTVQEMTGDIAKSIKWVHDHAKEYGGDPKTIFVAGHSAGAHLAALVCTDERYLKAEGLLLSSIKGCIPVDTAVYDIPTQVKGRGRLRAQPYTAAFGEDEKAQWELSPIIYVAKDKGIPPFLILHVASRPDSTAQSQAFAKALRDAGVEARVIPGENKDHATINRELGLPDDKPTEAVFEFLDDVLAKNIPADDAKNEAIKKDRKRIEGKWRVTALTVNGNKANDEDAKKITVVNGSDGTWSVSSEGQEISKGTSTFDPTKKPKTIDFTPTEGEAKGQLHLGIYELGADSRTLCFAPSGMDRPTEFSSTPENQHILVTLERVGKSP